MRNASSVPSMKSAPVAAVDVQVDKAGTDILPVPPRPRFEGEGLGVRGVEGANRDDDPILNHHLTRRGRMRSGNTTAPVNVVLHHCPQRCDPGRAPAARLSKYTSTVSPISLPYPPAIVNRHRQPAARKHISSTISVRPRQPRARVNLHAGPAGRPRAGPRRPGRSRGSALAEVQRLPGALLHRAQIQVIARRSSGSSTSRSLFSLRSGKFFAPVGGGT